MEIGKSLKSAKRRFPLSLDNFVGRVAVQLHFEKTKEKAILIQSDTMGRGQKRVCVRDKSLSLGQKSMVVSPAAHCSRIVFVGGRRADFCGLMLGRSRVKFQKFAKAQLREMITELYTA